MTAVPQRAGLHEEELVIHNRNCTDKPQRLLLRLFVDDGILNAQIPSLPTPILQVPAEGEYEETLNAKEKVPDTTHVLETPRAVTPCDRLDFGFIYLEKFSKEDSTTRVLEAEGTESPQTSRGTRLEARQTQPRRFVLQNRSDKDLQLLPRANLSMTVGWNSPSTESPPLPAGPTESGYHQCGDEYTLKPGERVDVYVTTPALPPRPVRRVKRSNEDLEGEPADPLERGLSLPIRDGMLLIERRTHKPSTVKGEDESESVICKVINVLGSYCLSLGALEQDELYVGTIASVWQILPFEFQVRNVSEAPLICKLKGLPKALAIEAPTTHPPDGSTADTCEAPILEIPPLSSVPIKATLFPSKVTDHPTCTPHRIIDERGVAGERRGRVPDCSTKCKQ